jgi:hypothetical protein
MNILIAVVGFYTGGIGRGCTLYGRSLCGLAYSISVVAAMFRNEVPLWPLEHKLILLSAIHLLVCGINSCGSGNEITGVNALEEFVRADVYIRAARPI